MNKRLSNKLTMLDGVHVYLADDENIYLSNPGMITVREKLHLKIAEIQNREIQRANVLKIKQKRKQLTVNCLSTADFPLRQSSLILVNKRITLS